MNSTLLGYTLSSGVMETDKNWVRNALIDNFPLNRTNLVKSRPIFKIPFSVESFIKYWVCSSAYLAPSSTTPDPVLASHDLTTYHLLRTFSSPCYSCTTFSSAIIFRRSSRHRKHLSLPISSIHCTMFVFHNLYKFKLS